ncbi:transcriptional regulator [Halopseudomonas pelagia]|uniref:Transcriptional regulator n=1 Tax=Halopseudomonas pelagia TaxID=553151 RepID=A0AA91U4E9_9GAMM|nr:transcriptional regulator [Halopseudomonas pelagia]PCD00614.1 transcriptional regulator [Halopseudomonas pelagia]QFY55316.1 transcriptional regulator [Halopseudomonas pelagia]
MTLAREQYQEYPINHPARKSARHLGWFSIGLGLVELCAPVPLARALGLPASTGVLLRLCGLRELATGAGLLLSDKPEPWVKARLAGDALDLAALGITMHCGDKPLNAALAAGGVAAIATMDERCAKGLASEHQLATVYDYSDRSGFPQPPSEMRGVAASDAPGSS